MNYTKGKYRRGFHFQKGRKCFQELSFRCSRLNFHIRFVFLSCLQRTCMKRIFGTRSIRNARMQIWKEMQRANVSWTVFPSLFPALGSRVRKVLSLIFSTSLLSLILALLWFDELLQMSLPQWVRKWDISNCSSSAVVSEKSYFVKTSITCPRSYSWYPTTWNSCKFYFPILPHGMSD